MADPEPGASYHYNIDIKEEVMSDYSDDSTESNYENGDNNNSIIDRLLEPFVASDSEVDDREISVREEDTGPTAEKKRKCMKVEEVNCNWNIRKIIERLNTEEQCLEFAINKGLIWKSRQCLHHRAPMAVKTKSSLWGAFYCYKRSCKSKTVSRAKNTVFDNCRLKLSVIFELMYFFSVDFTNDQAHAECYSDERDTTCSNLTILQWYSTFREAVVIYQIKHQSKKAMIGGLGCTVRIDESKSADTKFVNNKNTRGHWLMSIMEEGSSDFRVDIFPDNSNFAANLVKVIQKHVREGTRIRASDWDAYSCLAEHGYTVEVIRKLNERPWQVLKKAFRSGKGHVYGFFYTNFPMWFVEYSWRKKVKVNCLDPFESLIKCLQFVYPVKNS